MDGPGADPCSAVDATVRRAAADLPSGRLPRPQAAHDPRRGVEPQSEAGRTHAEDRRPL